MELAHSLRNPSDRVIQFEQVERAIVIDSGNAVGGTPTSQPYRRTLGARGELHFSAVDNWGWLPQSNTTFGGAAMLRSVTAFRRFIGKDDSGRPVEIDVRVRLDPRWVPWPTLP